MTQIRSIPYDELKVGMIAETRRLCVADDFLMFAHASGNLNPLSLGSAAGGKDGAEGNSPPAPSMWIGALISALLATKLPGPGTVYQHQSLDFLHPVRDGDEVVVSVELTDKQPDRVTVFKTLVALADGTAIASGEAKVIAPATAQHVDSADFPGLIVTRHRHFDALLKRAESLEALPTAVVVPQDENSLGGAILAAEHKLIIPVLVGDPDEIRSTARKMGVDISAYAIEPANGDHDAAAKAVAMVGSGRVQALMKGHLHTDILLSAVLSHDSGLRTGKRLSHVFVMDVPGLDHPIAVTDGAINIQPDLETKVDIVQNAVDMLHALGLEKPRVAVLAAVETINPKIPSTIDAAILSKMADRGQIRGAIVDGPLAMDNAMDEGAARTKGIISMVAGHSDLLVAPNLDAGNMLAKELTYVAHAEAAGIVLGAKCPIILTSRADNDKSRLASCAVAALCARHSGQA